MKKCLDSRRIVVTTYDRKVMSERTLSLKQALAIYRKRYDHFLDIPRGILEFRLASGDWVSLRLERTRLGPMSLGILEAVQLNAGTFLTPPDLAELMRNDKLYESNNVSRHVSVLRSEHREDWREPWFFVTRRTGGLAVMWPAERSFLRIDYLPESLRPASRAS